MGVQAIADAAVKSKAALTNPAAEKRFIFIPKTSLEIALLLQAFKNTRAVPMDSTVLHDKRLKGKN